MKNQFRYILLKDKENSEILISIDHIQSIHKNGGTIFVNFNEGKIIQIVGGKDKISDLFFEFLKSLEQVSNSEESLLPTINISRYECKFSSLIIKG